jgi:uncharacterized phosphosugar-binding protein
MSAEAYFRQAIDTLKRIADSQKEALEAAAGLLVEAITGGRAIFSFGASHSFMLTEELVYRTGGLMVINPIYPHGMNLSVRPVTLTSKLERLPDLGRELLTHSPARQGDILILTSTSGRNAVAIDMALQARQSGITIIGITSLAYTGAVESRHPSGKKLLDLCDIVLDNGAPAGDAMVEVPGFGQRVGPFSTVGGCALVNALASEVVARLVALGLDPPVFMSANLDGGDEHNARQFEKNRERIHYL